MINVNTLESLFKSDVARLWWWTRGVGPSLHFALSRPEYWLSTFLHNDNMTCINRWHPQWSRILIGHSQYVHQGHCNSFYNALEVSQSYSPFRGRARNYVIDQLNSRQMPGGLAYQYLKEMDDLSVFHGSVEEETLRDVLGMEQVLRGMGAGIQVQESYRKDDTLRDTVASLLMRIMHQSTYFSLAVVWDWCERYETWLPLMWYKALNLTTQETDVLLTLGPKGYFQWKYKDSSGGNEIPLLLD